MPRLTVDTASGQDVEISYEVTGEGAPVVLVHGWPLNGRSWEAQVGPLVEAGHQVITYDRRGFGTSSQPESGYDYDTFTADLDALLTHLDVTGATLVGFSMGGGEVVRYLARHGSDRVGKAVLAAAVPPYLYVDDDNPEGGLDDDTIAQFESGVKDDRDGFLETFVSDFFTAGDEELVSQELHDRTVALGREASVEATLACIAAFGRTDFRDDVAHVTVPTLVIHGDSDGIVPFEVSGKRSADAIGGATLHVVEGGPHGINATHAEEFNRVLIDFLAS